MPTGTGRRLARAGPTPSPATPGTPASPCWTGSAEPALSRGRNSPEECSGADPRNSSRPTAGGRRDRMDGGSRDPRAGHDESPCGAGGVHGWDNPSGPAREAPTALPARPLDDRLPLPDAPILVRGCRRSTLVTRAAVARMTDTNGVNW